MTIGIKHLSLNQEGTLTHVDLPSSSHASVPPDSAPEDTPGATSIKGGSIWAATAWDKDEDGNEDGDEDEDEDESEVE